MSKKSSDEQKPGVAKATLTPADLAQAVAEAHPEWLGQPMDARLLGQALREAFGVLRQQVDAVELGTVAVPSLGRFHARRAPNKPDLRRVLFLTPQWAVPEAAAAPAAADPTLAEATVATSSAEQALPVEPVVEAAPVADAEPVAAPTAPATPAKAPAKTSSRTTSRTTSKSSKRKR
ncbi:MAG: hypothetical protein U5L74_15205 [Ideonella sp.]|nr:hypothetical protein [Ideonella sp.]